MDNTMDNIKLYRLSKLFFGTLTLMFVGIIYAWSILKFPFEAMWEPSLLGFTYTLTVIFFLIGIFLSGLISKRISSRLRLIISAVLLFLGFFITSLLVEGDFNSIVLLFFAYGRILLLYLGIHPECS